MREPSKALERTSGISNWHRWRACAGNWSNSLAASSPVSSRVASKVKAKTVSRVRAAKARTDSSMVEDRVRARERTANSLDKVRVKVETRTAEIRMAVT